MQERRERVRLQAAEWFEVGEPTRTFSWIGYRDLIVATHQQLDAPLAWYRDNLNVRLAGQRANFAAQHAEHADHADRPRIVQLPAYAAELNLVEDV
ncbi:hypothetical protein [Nonomuraea sp. NPDC050783]|uniref:hypothetical protein n=1 Tax=Nonomuraea sp. NPDC050783 TaxID=3154634 RepID=UPI00346692A7